MNKNINKYYIYRHIRKDTNTPFYIGRGTKSRHLSKHSRNKYWNNITGASDWYSEIIIDNLTLDAANAKEIEFIKMYKSLGYCEANMSSGGESGSTGVSPWNKGIALTTQHAHKCGSAFRGKKRPGHAERLKVLWKQGVYSNRPKQEGTPVQCIDDNKVFESIVSAALHYNLHRQGVSKVCRGVLKTTGGLRFRYVGEHIINVAKDWVDDKRK